MKKTFFFLFALLMLGSPLMAQTPQNADPSAALEVDSTSKGFLPPRMTTTQRDAISSPATGLVIYNTNTNMLNLFDGTRWNAVASTPTIAFNVRTSTEQTPSLNDKINYNSEIFDTGNDFDLAADTFTAPHSGIYIFSFGLSTPGSDTGFLALQVNGQDYTPGPYAIVNSSITTHVGQTFTVKLTIGDVVHIRCASSDAGTISSAFFTGILIR